MIFVDASALCAVLLDEPERDAFALKLAQEPSCTSALAVWETARALERVTGKPPADSRRAVESLLDRLEIRMAPIGIAESALALEARDRFGQGRHPARLNMGDCFAYACAKANGAPLLFKGDDFVHTDVERA